MTRPRGRSHTGLKPCSTLLAAFLMLFALLAGGCRQDMHNQPKFIPLRSNDFFPDHSSARWPVAGTVAHGDYSPDTYFYTGKMGNQFGNVMPFPINMQVLERGQERYNIYCSPCHSRVGDGNGMVAQRGYKHPPDFIDPNLLQMPLGEFFDVISNGWGAMPDYKSQVAPEDRWAIVAYIRALQLTRHATPGDVPAGAKIQMPALPVVTGNEGGSTMPAYPAHGGEKR